MITILVLEPHDRVLLVKAPPPNVSWLKYRIAVTSRSVAAIFGGYGLASAFAAALAVWLPMSRADASITAQVSAFAVYACAVVWVFATRSNMRAWIGMIGLTLLFLGFYALKRWGIGL